MLLGLTGSALSPKGAKAQEGGVCLGVFGAKDGGLKGFLAGLAIAAKLPNDLAP